MKNTYVIQTMLMWCTYESDMDYVMLIFSVSYVIEKWSNTQIKNNLKYKGLNWKKLKINNQIEKKNR